MKPRTCPHCKQVIPIDRGFYFDEKNNLICGDCNKVVVATGWEKEPSFYKPPYSGVYSNNISSGCFR